MKIDSFGPVVAIYLFATALGVPKLISEENKLLRTFFSVCYLLNSPYLYGVDVSVLFCTLYNIALYILLILLAIFWKNIFASRNNIIVSLSNYDNCSKLDVFGLEAL